MKTILPIFVFAALLGGQELTPQQKQQVDSALPSKAPAKPRKPRRMLVLNLAKVGDRVVRGHPSIPAGTYAL